MSSRLVWGFVMSIWAIIFLSLVVFIATFLLAEWLANDGSLGPQDRKDRADREEAERRDRQE